MAHKSFISDSEIVKVELDNTKYNGDKYNIIYYYPIDQNYLIPMSKRK